MRKKDIIAYLEDFDDDTEIVLSRYDRKTGETHDVTLQICCNHEYQRNNGIVMLYELPVLFKVSK